MKSILISLITVVSAMAIAAETPAAKQSATATIKEAKVRVFFIEPKDGAKVSKTFKVKMGVEGMKVCPAGKETTDKACGHHHIIVDGAFLPEGTPIPNDASHLHYGKGQTETELTLTPGPHTLTMQFADFAHRSYGEKLSATIHITVK
jgi:hypothetical protein